MHGGPRRVTRQDPAEDVHAARALFLAATGGLVIVAAAVPGRGTADAGGPAGAAIGPGPGAPPAVAPPGPTDAAFGPTGPADPDAARPDTLEFRHRDHRSVDCVICHPSDDTHGGRAVERPADCHECHHRSADAPPCGRCHREREVREGTHDLRRSLELSTGTAPERLLGFDHADHESAACRDCHTRGAELSARDVACADCHEEHHRLESRCAACHLDPPEEVHPVDVVHVTCAGSGCHTSLPFDRVPRSRQACLSCHPDLTDHRPGRPCAECHALPWREPAPRTTPPEGDDG